ncbi:MAG: hypothetical protein R3C18_26920 [Planctomycetaceae bacterium]
MSVLDELRESRKRQSRQTALVLLPLWSMLSIGLASGVVFGVGNMARTVDLNGSLSILGMSVLSAFFGGGPVMVLVAYIGMRLVGQDEYQRTVEGVREHIPLSTDCEEEVVATQLNLTPVERRQQYFAFPLLVAFTVLLSAGVASLYACLESSKREFASIEGMLAMILVSITGLLCLWRFQSLLQPSRSND